MALRFSLLTLAAAVLLAHSTQAQEPPSETAVEDPAAAFPDATSPTSADTSSDDAETITDADTASADADVITASDDADASHPPAEEEALDAAPAADPPPSDSPDTAPPAATISEAPEYPITELEDAAWSGVYALLGASPPPLLADSAQRMALRARLHELLPYAQAGLVTFVPQPDGHVFDGPAALSATHLGEGDEWRAGGSAAGAAWASAWASHGVEGASAAAAQAEALSILSQAAWEEGSLPAGAVWRPALRMPPQGLAALVALNRSALARAGVQRRADAQLLGRLLGPRARLALPEPPALPAAAFDWGEARRPPPGEVLAFAREESVRRSFLHAWAGYERHAWGADILRPLSRAGAADLCKMGESILDALDTMLLMGLPGPFARSRGWVAEHLHFGGRGQVDINLFETTIRVVGGLLGAWELSADPLFLAAAARGMGAMLDAGAFESRSGLPFGTLTLWPPRGEGEGPPAAPELGALGTRGAGGGGYAFNPPWSGGTSALAEVATLQLELRALSRDTRNGSFAALGARVMRHLAALDPPLGLFPIAVDPASGLLRLSPITLGARGDSAYEYMLKQWLAARGEAWAAERAASAAGAALGLQLVLSRRALLRGVGGPSLGLLDCEALGAGAGGCPEPSLSEVTSATPVLPGEALRAHAQQQARHYDLEEGDPRQLLTMYNKAVCGILDVLREVSEGRGAHVWDGGAAVGPEECAFAVEGRGRLHSCCQRDGAPLHAGCGRITLRQLSRD